MLFSVLPLSQCKLSQHLPWLYLITESKAQVFEWMEGNKKLFTWELP